MNLIKNNFKGEGDNREGKKGQEEGVISQMDIMECLDGLDYRVD